MIFRKISLHCPNPASRVSRELTINSHGSFKMSEVYIYECRTKSAKENSTEYQIESWKNSISLHFASNVSRIGGNKHEEISEGHSSEGYEKHEHRDRK